MKERFTIMIIPEAGKKVISFQIPLLLFRSLSVAIILLVTTIVVFAYDYKKILDQVYENKHLSIENKNLRDQLNIFQMKLTSLTQDIDRIQIFESKLRTLTGLKDEGMEGDEEEEDQDEENARFSPEGHFRKLERSLQKKDLNKKQQHSFLPTKIKETKEEEEDFANLQELYRNKMAEDFGIPIDKKYARFWFDLTQEGLSLAEDYAKFDVHFNKLREVVQTVESSIHNIDLFLIEKESMLLSTPTIMPAQGWITSYYGPRKSPYSGKMKMHEGLDIGSYPGTPIVAAADGIVSFSGNRMGFGNIVQIDHGYGIETAYAHAKRLFARKGSIVKRGDLIAEVGNSGLSTGPHLHYEIRINGTAVDPLYFILN